MFKNHNSKPAGNVAWLCLILLTLLLSFGLSWLMLLPLDFAYQWFYGVIEIDQHIAQFGPENYIKNSFELTTQAERFDLFSAIVTAIHHQGVGLDELVYHNAEGMPIATLLTHEEVVHLQDVAILLEQIKVLLIISVVLFVGLLSCIYRSNQLIPTFSSMLFTVLVFLVLVIALVFIIGPYDVFYKLHVWAFPAEHKWFFYYEESLMSTMMKAPDLFGYIAVLLLAIALPVFVLIMWLIRRIILFKNNQGLAR